jgi:microsomal epoxide hydrolase/non-specific protein-tyrosine kinase
MKDFPDPQYVQAGDTRLAVYEAGDGAPIILVHGWPEIAYSWKHQISALARAGFRAIAPDLKGFGHSDAPKEATRYDVRAMTSDLAHLLDAMEIDRAIFCGHDWGGSLVWSMAQLHPDRVVGVISVCTPHRPPPPVPPLSIIRQRFGDKHYFIQFQEPGAADALFATDVERFFQLMFRRPPTAHDIKTLGSRIFDLSGRFRDGPAPNPADVIIPPDDLQVFIDAYSRSGFHGGVNLYRNIDANYEIMKTIDPLISAPCLWIGAENDAFLPPAGAEGMEALIPDLEKHIIADCGHWVMWEKPQDLSLLMIDWLKRRFA